MGLLAGKSQSDNLFYYGTDDVWFYNKAHYIHYQRDEKDLSIDLYDRCNRKKVIDPIVLEMVNIKEDTIYTFDKLINANLYAHVGSMAVLEPDMVANETADDIRVLLHSMDLLNEHDKEYLISIGFTEADMEKSIYSLGLDNNLSATLSTNVLHGGAIYDGTHNAYPLWRLLLLDKNYILNSEGMNEDNLKEIEDAVEALGFSLRVAEKAKVINTIVKEDGSGKIVLPEGLDEKTLEKCNKIIASRESYLKKIKEYNEKVRKSEKKLQLTLDKAAKKSDK